MNDFGLSAGSTLYGSYLIQVSQNVAASSQSVANMYVNSTASDGSTSSLRVDGDGFNSVTYAQVKTAGGNGDGSPMLAGTTYMVLFQLNNLESTSSQTLNSWLLNSAQFDHFRNGAFDAATLNAASAGTGPANIMSTASATLATGNVGVTIDSLNAYFGLFQGNSYTTYAAIYDELRFSATDLKDATTLAIPEPGTLVLVGVALGTLLLVNRRKR
jgi:hypothetical protein